MGSSPTCRSLRVLPVSVWVLSRYCSFLQQFDDLHSRLTGNSATSLCVQMVVCLSALAVWWTFLSNVLSTFVLRLLCVSRSHSDRNLRIHLSWPWCEDWLMTHSPTQQQVSLSLDSSLKGRSAQDPVLFKCIMSSPIFFIMSPMFLSAAFLNLSLCCFLLWRKLAVTHLFIWLRRERPLDKGTAHSPLVLIWLYII